MATREELAHAIRASCEIIRQPGVIVIGSQSVLATWTEKELPDESTASLEIDVCPLSDDDSESLADTLDWVLGQDSPFDQSFGFYIDGVGRRTATLPAGFEDRLIAVENPQTNGYVGYCLDPHDLCVAKLVADRDKDRTFVNSLIENRLVDPREIDARLSWTDTDEGTITRAESFLAKHVELWNLLDIEPANPEDTLRNDAALPYRAAVQIADAARRDGEKDELTSD